MSLILYEKFLKFRISKGEYCFPEKKLEKLIKGGAPNKSGSEGTELFFEKTKWQEGGRGGVYLGPKSTLFIRSKLSLLLCLPTRKTHAFSCQFSTIISINFEFYNALFAKYIYMVQSRFIFFIFFVRDDFFFFFFFCP